MKGWGLCVDGERENKGRQGGFPAVKGRGRYKGRVCAKGVYLNGKGGADRNLGEGLRKSTGGAENRTVQRMGW